MATLLRIPPPPLPNLTYLTEDLLPGDWAGAVVGQRGRHHGIGLAIHLQGAGLQKKKGEEKEEEEEEEEEEDGEEEDGKKNNSGEKIAHFMLSSSLINFLRKY